MYKFLDRYFHLSEVHSSIKQELIAGVTVFFTAAYILIINPLILQDAGIPLAAGLFATLSISFLGSLLMGLWGKVPVIQIPGMGVNAFFTYTIVHSAGLTASQALFCSLCAGLLFLGISLTPLTKALQIGVPQSLKYGMTAGIGVFLAFIGLQKGGLIVSSPQNFVALGRLDSVSSLLTLGGVLAIGLLYIKRVKGSFIIGLVVITVLNTLILGKPKSNTMSVNWHNILHGFGHLTIPELFSGPFLMAVFSLTMLIVFENMGMLYGLLNDSKRFPSAYRASAVSTVFSALLGTSPSVAAAESAAGIEEGGKTGLTAVVAGLLFLLAIVILPFIGYIPNCAIAPILIIIGGIMMQQVKEIPFHDFSESFPSFLIILLIPLTYSIADGIAFGFIAYPVFKLMLGKRKQVSPILYIIAFLFLLHFIALSYMA